MEQFIVSARKYRPKKFEDVIGQSHITDTLENAIKTNTLAQSFLFCGPRGVGKTTCARILAKYINESNTSSDEEVPNDFNIYELDAASNNSVEDIRNLIDQVRYAPQQGKYKVYIIDEVHMLSQSAFNAFLKTLEEPPSYAIFILATTEKHKIIPTILSRCQIFDFKRIQPIDISGYLEKIAQNESIQYDIDALHLIAQKADGALRDALSMFDRIASFAQKNISLKATADILNVLDYDYYFKATDAILKEDISALLLIFEDVLKSGFDGDMFINGLGEHLRNLLVAKDKQTINLIEAGENLKERYKQQATISNDSFLLSALNIINDCEVNYKLSKNKRLHVELALIKICFINARLDSSDSIGNSEVPSKKNTSLQKPVEAKSDDILANSSLDSKSEIDTEDISTAKKEEPYIQKEEAKAPPQVAEEPQVKETQEPTQMTESAAEEKIENPQEEVRPNKKEVAEPEEIPKKTSQEETEDMKLPELGSLKLQSLENLSKSVEEEEEEKRKTLAAESQTEKIIIDNDKLNLAWKKYLQQLQEEDKISLYASFSQSKIGVKDESIAEIKVYNQLQADQLDSERTNLVEYLATEMQLPKVELIVTVDKTDRPQQEKKLYTASDKFKRMAEKNPNLLELKNRLDLNLEY